MSKSKKIDKEFLLTDSTVNSYGFRLLTSGYLRSEYEKNPVGYYMHGTSAEHHPREEGVLVTWSDFRQDGDQVYAKPTINLNHPRGQKSVEEIEGGFLNAASLGHFVVLEMDKNPASFLPNQTGPTVTKWFNRECSLVDIPGNFNALKLYDKDGEEINLADFQKKQINMKQIFLSAAQLAVIPNLKAEPTQAELDTAFSDLVAKSAKVDGLESQLSAATTAKETAEGALKALQAETVQKDVTDQLAAAVGTKITVETQKQLAVDYAGKPAELKNLLAALPAYQSVVKNLNPNLGKVADLMDKSYDELDKAGKLEALKATAPDTFFEKYEEHFGKRHASDTRK